MRPSENAVSAKPKPVFCCRKQQTQRGLPVGCAACGARGFAARTTGRLKPEMRFSDGLLLGFALTACVGCAAQPRTRLGRSGGLRVRII
ncbi:hypothetical protein [Kingella potus]|uniref:hypothetical protein n=1 Tax=Kingella potus TaxID=265175 RepID=UPI001FD36877|nr:hypothetical protein [Kingella potus]UOP00092.1 hypothetical protein LVJ84_08940 [Kingella potus]